jgi:hypothetical protein
MSSADALPGPSFGHRTLGRGFYRLRQGLHALHPSIDAITLAVAQESLLAGERHLFGSMEKRDQRHAVAVISRLRARGVTDRDLLAAALLHDCGKGPVPVWLRSLNVLARPLVDLLATEEGPGALGAAYRLLHHPALGAAIARAAGSSEATVRYIGGRVRPEEEAKMELLKAADDES